jgi:hypothetical protein
VDSVACGIIAVWVVIRLRHYPLSTIHSQLSTINYYLGLRSKNKNFTDILILQICLKHFFPIVPNVLIFSVGTLETKDFHE